MTESCLEVNAVTYDICYEEVIHHDFSIEAETADDIESEFERLAGECAFDFTGGDVVSCGITKITADGIRRDLMIDHLLLERLVIAFKRYVENNAQDAELSYVYEALKNAGLSDEQIGMLGFSYCMPNGNV